MIRHSRFLDYVDRMQAARVLVIGPAVAEIDAPCAVARLAPDRPVPVYHADQPSVHPGGAGLTAATIKSLGGSATLIAPIGRGTPGQALRGSLADAGVRLLEAASHETTRTPELFRYIASGGRQLLQVRRGWHPTPFAHLEEALRRFETESEINTTGRPCDCVCIVDGLPTALTAADVQIIATFAKRWNVPVVFDSAGGDLVPPNTLDHVIVNERESQIIGQVELVDHIERLRDMCANVAPHVLLTLGRNGAVAGRRTEDGDVANYEVTPITTTSHALSDRRGVGFLLSGVYALAIAVDASAEEAAYLACGAATAAATSPGPKRIGVEELLKIAYREIESHVVDGIEVFGRIARDLLPTIDQASRQLMEAYTKGRMVLVFGNGGSAAEANHLVGELTGRFKESRPGLPSISLSANDSLTTCLANDYGYEDVFARQIDAFCRPGDVVIGLSTSGTSPNVVRGIERAKLKGATTIALVGEDARDLGEVADLVVSVPSRSTPRIQEAHLFVIHVMCDMLDRRLDAQGRLHPSASEI